MLNQQRFRIFKKTIAIKACKRIINKIKSTIKIIIIIITITTTATKSKDKDKSNLKGLFRLILSKKECNKSLMKCCKIQER